MLRIFIAMLLLGISHAVCFFVMTEMKYSARKTALIYGGYAVVFVGISMLLAFVFGISATALEIGFIGTILLALICFMLTSADPACKKIFLFISYANVFCICACLALILCTLLFKGASEIFLYYARNIARTVLFILMAFVYIKLLRPYVKTVSGQQRKIWHSISCVSGLFLAIFASCVIVFYANGKSFDRYIPFFAAAVLVYAATLRVIFGTIKFMIAENNSVLVYQNVAYLQEQLETAKEHEVSARAVRHDFRHHNRNLETMLKNGEVNEAIRYLEKYNDSLDEIKMNDFCPNITVNAILNSFYTKAEGTGIVICIESDVTQDTAISDMDFNAILSNLLENAVNGCKERGEGGKIKLNIRSVDDKTVIVCTNSCKRDIAVENGMLKNAGIGISSILLAIRKYEGDIKYSYTDEELTACIILNA